MSIKKLIFVSVIAAASVVSGCKPGFLGGGELPAAPQPQAPAAPVVVEGIRTSYADVVDRTSPAVVRIEASHKEKAPARVQIPGGDDFFKQFQMPQQNQRPQIERGLGSGVIVDSNGTILTNNHVVEGADKIPVPINDNKTYEATSV